MKRNKDGFIERFFVLIRVPTEWDPENDPERVWESLVQAGFSDSGSGDAASEVGGVYLDRGDDDDDNWVLEVHMPLHVFARRLPPGLGIQLGEYSDTLLECEKVSSRLLYQNVEGVHYRWGRRVLDWGADLKGVVVETFVSDFAARASELPNAYQNWKATGDGQPHWGRKYIETDDKGKVVLDPLIVFSRYSEEYAIAVPLPFGRPYASTGTYRFPYTPEEWAKLKGTELYESSWNGYYFRPVPTDDERPEKQVPYVVWSAWA